jgi:hypothetical protein
VTDIFPMTRPDQVQPPRSYKVVLREGTSAENVLAAFMARKGLRQSFNLFPYHIGVEQQLSNLMGKIIYTVRRLPQYKELRYVRESSKLWWVHDGLKKAYPLFMHIPMVPGQDFIRIQPEDIKHIMFSTLAEPMDISPYSSPKRPQLQGQRQQQQQQQQQRQQQQQQQRHAAAAAVAKQHHVTRGPATAQPAVADPSAAPAQATSAWHNVGKHGARAAHFSAADTELPTKRQEQEPPLSSSLPKAPSATRRCSEAPSSVVGGSFHLLNDAIDHMEA